MSDTASGIASQPQISRGPQGEPHGLLVAEKTLYVTFPGATAHYDWALRRARIHMAFALQEMKVCADNPEQNPYVLTPALKGRIDVVQYLLAQFETQPDLFMGNESACVEVITKAWRTRMLPLVQTGEATWAELGFVDPFTKRLHP